MRFNFYLRNPKKKGRTAIYLSVTYRGERIILFPGESIETANWINKKGINKPKPISENNGLIGRLMRFEQLVRDMYDELQRATNDIVPAEVLKNAIEWKGKKISVCDFMLEKKSSKKKKIQKYKNRQITICIMHTTFPLYD